MKDTKRRLFQPAAKADAERAEGGSGKEKISEFSNFPALVGQKFSIHWKNKRGGGEIFPSLVSQDPPPALLQPLTNAPIALHYMTIAFRGHIEKSNLKKCPKSLPIITTTARVPHSRPKPSESPHLFADLKSPTTRASAS